MQVLEWSQQISDCKSMQIFYDAQGKLTPQSEVGSTLNSTHPSFYGCPCYQIQSKMKALKWSQQCYIINQFLSCSRVAYS